MTLLIALWIATVFSLLTAIAAHSFFSFCSLRFFTGLGLGALLPLGVTYMNEFTPQRLLNSFSIWGWLLGFASGGVVASAVGVWLTPRYGWQILYYAGSLSFLPAIACHILLPESIKFSALRGDRATVMKMMARLIPASRQRFQAADATLFFPESNARPASISLLLSSGRRRNSLLLWTSAFFVLFSIYGLTGWVPSAMMKRGESFSASFSYGALVQASGFFGTLFCGIVADRLLGSRRSMMIWWIMGAITVGSLGVFNNHWVNLLGVAGGGFFILGAQGILNNYTANTAETEVRATAVGMMLGVGRVGAILGPYVLGWIQQVTRQPSIFFLAISAASLAAVLSIALIKPVQRADGVAVL